jgi:hypothetical protein
MILEQKKLFDGLDPKKSLMVFEDDEQIHRMINQFMNSMFLFARGRRFAQKADNRIAFW